jgi:hypothetical protein
MTLDPLFVDVYPGDGTKDWSAFIAAGPPWHGAIFKLTQGLDYEYSNWARLQRMAFTRSDRYARDLWDGFYHYLTLHQDGATQAERFWLYLERIGGERAGTLWGMVDVERGGQRIQNPSRQLVVDTTQGFAERYRKLSGRGATLYGGELLRSVAVGGRMGCDRSAVALYGAELHGKGESTSTFLKRTGTDLEHLMLWQYDGDGEGKLPGYPLEAPGCGKVDISVLTLPGGLEALRAQLWAEAPTP